MPSLAIRRVPLRSRIFNQNDFTAMPEPQTASRADAGALKSKF
jgi:hypothetical protein